MFLTVCGGESSFYVNFEPSTCAIADSIAFRETVAAELALLVADVF